MRKIAILVGRLIRHLELGYQQISCRGIQYNIKMRIKSTFELILMFNFRVAYRDVGSLYLINFPMLMTHIIKNDVYCLRFYD